MNSSYNEFYSSPNNIQYFQKKTMTYDDILSSMKMVVSSDGVLQYISTNNDLQPDFNQNKEIEGYNKNKIEPQLKNSYIYNKFFKNYKDPNAAPIIPRKPLSLHEIKMMRLNRIIQQHNARLRIAQVKPKKISYTTNANTYVQLPPRPTRLPNRLFKLKLQ